ncbi:MAG: histidine kinase [Acidobacteriota bacterium]
MRKAALEGQPRAVAGLIWASAYLTYLLAYSGAIRLGLTMDIATSLVVGLMNSIPEALAAPIVLRVAGSSPWPGGRSLGGRAALLLLGVGFVVWSILGAASLYAVYHHFAEGGAWEFTLDTRTMAWKALISFLVFALLAGVGRASAFAREARSASARAERAETLRAEARLAVLRAQLNPHFILNVLHSLVGLAERDPPLTATTLERLGTTLRYALRVQSQGLDQVTLREELAFVRDYLALEGLRLGDRLEVRFAVDQTLLDRPVPPFVLQPLVENAVRHAIAPRARGGIVAIEVRADGGSLALSVDDDGDPVVGTAQGVQTVPGVGSGGGSGVGLRLLSDRIEALYGQDAALETGRSSMGGFHARVRLPAQQGADTEPGA